MDSRLATLGPRAAALAVAVAVLAPVEPRAETAPTTVILVRHAEKRAGDDDPGLSRAGHRRARELARALADAGVRHAYSSQYRRARETLRPLAERRGLDVEVVPVGGADLGAYARDFMRRVLGEGAGSTAVIAGHSNTVPLLIEALGVRSAPRLAESDYDDLFVVTVDSAGDARLLHLHYGSPTP